MPTSLKRCIADVSLQRVTLHRQFVVNKQNLHNTEENHVLPLEKVNAIFNIMNHRGKEEDVSEQIRSNNDDR